VHGQLAHHRPRPDLRRRPPRPHPAPMADRARLRPGGEVQRAEAVLADHAADATPLLAASSAMYAWIEGAGPGADARRAGPPLGAAPPAPGARAAHRGGFVPLRRARGSRSPGGRFSGGAGGRGGGRAHAVGQHRAGLVGGAPGRGRTPAPLPRAGRRWICWPPPRWSRRRPWPPGSAWRARTARRAGTWKCCDPAGRSRSANGRWTVRAGRQSSGVRRNGQSQMALSAPTI
jgi:hypothetical protein